VKSFIVRLWQHPAGFEAELLALSNGQSKTFRDLEALFAYLQEQAEMKPEPGNDGGR
jgi:hypothetical protein